MTDPTPQRRPFLTPSWLIYGLLVVEGLLWLSERYRWFWFNERKGWTVLIGVAVVGGTMLVMLLWFIVALVFRRRFQFSIRSLLVLMVAVAIPCSWLAVNIQHARKQKAAVEAICALGCSVLYDWDPDAPDDTGDPFRDESNDPFGSDLGKSSRADSLQKRARTCLCRSFGQDFVSDVVVCDNLTGWQIGHHAPLCDADVAQLRDLPHLQILSLSDAKISNAGLASLEGLARLTELDLKGTPITDAGLEHLGRLTQLEKLDLSATPITGAGLEHLKRMTRLRVLRFVDTNLTDAGLEHLQRLTQLETLDLCHTKVGNAGLEHLKPLSRLRELYLLDTWADEAGVASLKASLPDVNVRFSTRWTAADVETIRSLLDRTAEYHGLTVVSVDPADGGGAEVRLTVRPHFSGPCLLLKKKLGKWEIVDRSGSWIGEGPSE